MGAWDIIYKEGVKADPGTPVGYALIALKRRLAANGFEGTMNMTATYFGTKMHHQTVAFQKHAGLVADGEIGPRTAAALFASLFTELAQSYDIPDNLVCKGCKLESDVDPGAVGVADPHDLGIMQINAPSHPALTIDKLFDAEWALDYYARSLLSQFDALDDWDCAIAAWNIGGGGAQYWCQHGKPASLYASWFVDKDGNPIDLGARATQYVSLVRSRDC